jgi:small conductance mechanosensitive channel
MDAIFVDLTKIINQWANNFVEALPLIVVGLIIVILSIVLARILANLIQKALNARGTDREINILLSRIVRWTILAFGILVAFQQAGTDITAFLTGLGVLGFTVGFALQDVSSNFVAGILLLWQQPFDIGDTILVNDYVGEVKNINLRDTEIFSVEGLSIRIPNSDVFTNAITNYTQTNRRRIELEIGVSYDTDLKRAQDAALKAVSEIDGLLEDPEPQMVFHTFGGTTVNGTLYIWADLDQLGYQTARGQVLGAIKSAYEAAKIEMPFPTQQLLISQR